MICAGYDWISRCSQVGMQISARVCRSSATIREWTSNYVSWSPPRWHGLSNRHWRSTFPPQRWSSQQPGRGRACDPGPTTLRRRCLRLALELERRVHIRRARRVGHLRAADRESPVIIATQGHSAEQDHLDEAVERDIVWGVFRKSGGPALLLEAVERVGRGERLPTMTFPTGASRISLPRIHTYFATTRGRTAARMAGAIASGRAISHQTLAEVAQVEYDTASKIGRDYLGDLICRRGEHTSNHLPARVPAPVVYRWCGEHARYILSWCRRNGQTDVATRVIPIPQDEQSGNDVSGLGRAGWLDNR